MTRSQRLEVPVQGMDCDECVQHVEKAVGALAGVASVRVLLGAEKAIAEIDPTRTDEDAVKRAIQESGYSCGLPPVAGNQQPERRLPDTSRAVLTLLGVVFGAVLFVVVVGEWLGLFEQLTKDVPWPAWAALVLVAGYPVFRNVLRAALKRQVTSHTLMTVGLIAAVAVGEWATALLIVFFMRIGDYAESFTTERARKAVKSLTSMAPRTARVERGDVLAVEEEVPLEEVAVGDIVVVRPGEAIPVDGEVISGQATVDQAAITGESMPAEAAPGSKVFAASIARLGSLRIRTSRIGPDTTFGRVIRMVEEAEANRADVQRIADRFSAVYLPVVATIAALTFILRNDPLATAAVLVIACSCAFALATPIAMLASVGAAARRGLLVKGSKYLELLARADVVLLDKTGTLTFGRPQITDVLAFNGLSEDEVIGLAASAERYSEHPLAEAVRSAASERGIALTQPEQFEAVPGLGLKATVNGKAVTVGNEKLVGLAGTSAVAGDLQRRGRTAILVARDGELVGALAAEDTLRPEVPAALAELRRLGVKRIELLTGDNEATAAALGERLGIYHRASLMPEDKIAIVKRYQAEGHTVVMVGDGVNDAPALAQAGVGIAMGAAGTDVALEAAHIALMRDDWSLVPDAFRIARRTMSIVKLNICFTAVYNLAGLSLAALGFIPPVIAAAAQSLPDLGILANSSRLLRQR